MVRIGVTVRRLSTAVSELSLGQRLTLLVGIVALVPAGIATFLGYEASSREVTDRVGSWRAPEALTLPVDSEFVLRALRYYDSVGFRGGKFLSGVANGVIVGDRPGGEAIDLTRGRGGGRGSLASRWAP